MARCYCGDWVRNPYGQNMIRSCKLAADGPPDFMVTVGKSDVDEGWMAEGRRRIKARGWPEGRMGPRTRIRVPEFLDATKEDAMRAADEWLGQKCGMGGRIGR